MKCEDLNMPVMSVAERVSQLLSSLLKFAFRNMLEKLFTDDTSQFAMSPLSKDVPANIPLMVLTCDVFQSDSG